MLTPSGWRRYRYLEDVGGSKYRYMYYMYIYFTIDKSTMNFNKPNEALQKKIDKKNLKDIFYMDQTRMVMTRDRLLVDHNKKLKRVFLAPN